MANREEASVNERRPEDEAVGEPSADGEGVLDYFSTEKIFRRVHATAKDEIDHSVQVLFLSGLAAGLSLGLSFVCSAALTALVPGEGAHLVGSLLYPVGFLLVIGGRYQLFTENTLTPVTLVLTGHGSVWDLLRLWGVVLMANVVGAALVALVLARTSILTPEGTQVALEVAEHAIDMTWGSLFWKGVFAGWLMASIVWLVHSSQEATLRFLVVFLITYTIPVAGFAHCITGTCETLYLVFMGGAGVGPFLAYFTAVVAGNTMGGVLLVAVLNYAQTQDQENPEQKEDEKKSA